MLIAEHKTEHNKEYIYYYSDLKYYIKQVETQEKYIDAYIPIEVVLERTFVETDEKI